MKGLSNCKERATCLICGAGEGYGHHKGPHKVHDKKKQEGRESTPLLDEIRADVAKALQELVDKYKVQQKVHNLTDLTDEIADEFYLWSRRGPGKYPERELYEERCDHWADGHSYRKCSQLKNHEGLHG